MKLLRMDEVTKNRCMFLVWMEDGELWLSELELEPLNSATIIIGAKMRELLLKCNGL